MLSFKLHANSELRRFQLDSATSFSAFRFYLERYYFITNETPVQYKDSDGDLILLSNENDFSEMKRLHAPTATIQVFAGTSIDIPVKKMKAEEQPHVIPTAAATAAPASAAAASPFAALFGGGAGGGLPIEHILSLAKSPQGEAFLSQFGLNSTSAAGLLNQYAKAAGHAAPANSTAGNNSNNNEKSGSSEVAICDECDLAITADTIRFHCLDCPDFDLHEKCKSVCLSHDAAHRFVTQFASNEQTERLMELANVPRELAVEMLNCTNGSFEQALEKLLQ